MPLTSLKPNSAETGGTSDQIIYLVQKARGGSRAAFAQLIDMFQAEIFRMAYYRTHSRMDAEDITQDVFTQAFDKLPKLKETQRFRAWLFSIALNRIRDLHRKRRIRALFAASRHTGGDPPEDEQSRSNSEGGIQLQRREFWRQVDGFLQRLPGGEKEVFRLRFLDQMNIREISRVLKKNESTVKTQLYRAIGKFREEPGLRKLLRENTP
jgi:RNA polymerase sigma-70 factor (ECF subfamily)